MLVLSVEEISEMLTGMSSLPGSMSDAAGQVEGWVEHMRAGDLPCGRTIPDSVPASSRVGASPPHGLILVLSIEEVALALTELGPLPASEHDAHQRVEAWVEQTRAFEVPCGRTLDAELIAPELGDLE
jgi:hypothetical protein